MRCGRRPRAPKAFCVIVYEAVTAASPNGGSEYDLATGNIDSGGDKANGKNWLDICKVAS